MESSTGKKRTLTGSLLLVVLGVVLWGAFNTGMEATNTLEFCISCHEMESTVYQEYRHSVHFSNPSGVRAACPDCHVPKQWVPKIIRKIQASNEVYHWWVGTIDTREKFEARRPHLASHVWQVMKETDSRECRNCHQFTVMKLAGQARFAARIHKDAMDEGKTCIDCHKGIAHDLPQRELTASKVQEKAEVDMEYAEEINETCAGCHGEHGEGSLDGEYPRLAGLSAEYLATQLRQFKSRDRLNIPMVPFTDERELPEEDVIAISHYLSSIELPSKLAPLEEEDVESESFDAFARLKESRAVVNIGRYPGNEFAGEHFYKKECAGCHGERGFGGAEGLTPPLAGQRSQYLLRQVQNFRNSDRLHDDPRDSGIFQQFGDGQIADMLAYLSLQDD